MKSHHTGFLILLTTRTREPGLVAGEIGGGASYHWGTLGPKASGQCRAVLQEESTGGALGGGGVHLWENKTHCPTS